MVKLLLIADDFTGALDTGIQFAKRGIKTQIFTKREIACEDIKEDTEVLVVDTESRPMSSGDAGRAVEELTRWAVGQGIAIIFKKTDSALRGNIGAELESAARAAEKPLYFLPGHPCIRRITKNGVHYIDGEPLSDSVFGKDPFEPVTESYIPDIIAKQSHMKVECLRTDEATGEEETPQIVVCDVQTTEDMDRRLDELIEKGRIGLIAGCAALADRLAEKIAFCRTEKKSFWKTERFFVACGSLNRITKEQVDYAQKQGGFARLHLSMEQKLNAGYYETEAGKRFLEQMVKTCRENRKVLVDSFDTDDSKEEFLREHQIPAEQIRVLIAGAHGRIVRELVSDGLDITVLMTGGDTLMGYMKLTGCSQLEPVCEIEPGVVVSVLEQNGRRQQVISKSGGFGEKGTLCRVADKILK